MDYKRSNRSVIRLYLEDHYLESWALSEWACVSFMSAGDGECWGWENEECWGWEDKEYWKWEDQGQGMG
jgi:hypothetical protein